MPRSHSVDLNNDDGNIYLDNLEGRAVINCDYGKVAIGNLFARDNDINLDYSPSSTIHYIKSGNVNIDYSKLSSLSGEAVDKLSKVKPTTIGQASRISGVSPADVSVLLVYLGR